MNQQKAVGKILVKIGKRQKSTAYQQFALYFLYAGTIFAISSVENSTIVLLLWMAFSIELCLILAFLVREMKLNRAFRKAERLIDQSFRGEIRKWTNRFGFENANLKDRS